MNITPKIAPCLWFNSNAEEAISLSVDCEAQEAVDRLWGRLTAGGSESQCGWLKDKFGL